MQDTNGRLLHRVPFHHPLKLCQEADTISYWIQLPFSFNFLSPPNTFESAHFLHYVCTVLILCMYSCSSAHYNEVT